MGAIKKKTRAYAKIEHDTSCFFEHVVLISFFGKLIYDTRAYFTITFYHKSLSTIIVLNKKNVFSLVLIHVDHWARSVSLEDSIYSLSVSDFFLKHTLTCFIRTTFFRRRVNFKSFEPFLEYTPKKGKIGKYDFERYKEKVTFFGGKAVVLIKKRISRVTSLRTTGLIFLISLSQNSWQRDTLFYIFPLQFRSQISFSLSVRKKPRYLFAISYETHWVPQENLYKTRNVALNRPTPLFL